MLLSIVSSVGENVAAYLWRLITFSIHVQRLLLCEQGQRNPLGELFTEVFDGAFDKITI